MAEYMHLIGTEDVRNAANTIRDAADRMAQIPSSLEWVLAQHANRMEQIVVRFEEAAEKLSNATKGGGA